MYPASAGASGSVCSSGGSPYFAHGRTTDRADPSLTFGQEAVYGTVPYRGQAPLRITTIAGGAWLVATDRSKLPPDINRGTTRNGKPDYLVPPAFSAAQESLVSDIGTALVR